MIKNDRQFGIIRGRVERLERLRQEIEQRLAAAPTDEQPRLGLELKAVETEMRRMQDDLSDYEALKEGRAEIGAPKSLEDLPRLLIRARIAARLTQAELADRLTMKEQQIQRYEATDYESASLARLIDVAEALDLRLSPELGGELQSGVATPRDSDAELLATLERTGLDRKFVAKRIGPIAGRESRGLVSRLAHVFGWLPEDILAGDVKPPRVGAVAYKMPKRASQTKSALLTGYAHFLAQLAAQATEAVPAHLPIDPVEMHHRIVGNALGPVSLASALEAMWSCGVPVIPLREPGGFDAGYFHVAGRDVVVVNSMHRQESRWLFYLLHEAGHVAERTDQLMLVEEGVGHEPTVAEDLESRANRFATDAIFAGRSEELFKLVLEKSQGKMALLQRAVVFVARNHHVDPGILALNVAYRLAEEGEDWWGAALSLQQPDGDPWETARDILIRHVDWATLEPLDADLLARALETTPPLVALTGETTA
jgi:transcriptional regulator with XRE-family HTH domain